MIKMSILAVSISIGLLSFNSTTYAEEKQPDILIGLDADMSSGSAKAGEAIKRGMEIAVDEINGQGGVLGRNLDIIVKDHRGNPARGVDNLEELARTENLVAVMGGLHTPVAMHELKTIHKNGLPFLVPWAAGTPVVANGFDPNFVFRVSVRDEYAGGFMVKYAVEKGFTKIGLALENTGWGRSNEKAMKEALKQVGLSPVSIGWFHWGTQDMEGALSDILSAKPDAILLVANAPEGLNIVSKMASLPKEDRVPIISHWGITGGNFFEKTKSVLKDVDLVFLQTYSFFKPTEADSAQRLIALYGKKYGVEANPESIFAPVGTAHAYDLVHLLAKAIAKAGSTDRKSIREALVNLQEHLGLVRAYSKPFANGHQDALRAEDFSIARYRADGSIFPVWPQ
ncbi:MAG: ABC transporter substrate-binding protein [Gammaproteobacteria bacterium]